MYSCKNKKMKWRGGYGASLVLLFVLLAQAGTQAAVDATVPEGTRITLQLNNQLSTKQNNEGDAFTAVVMTPLYQGDRLVIPKGSVVTGSISRILRPGRFKGKALMNLLFQSINIPGRGELQIIASLSRVDPEGNTGVRSEGTVQGKGSEGRDIGNVLKPGLAGAGIGTLAGGGKGAGIGAGVGAAIGLATVFATRGKDLEFRRGATMDISLDRPLVVPLEGESSSAKNR
jgi:hypothetical protein